MGAPLGDTPGKPLGEPLGGSEETFGGTSEETSGRSRLVAMLAAALRVVGGGNAELQSRMQAVQPVVEAHLCGTRVDFGFLLNGSQKQNLVS